MAVGLAIVLAFVLAARAVFDSGSVLVNSGAALLMIAIIVLPIDRLGLVATVALFLTNMMMSSAVITLDSSKWFFGNALLTIAVPTLLAFWVLRLARRGAVAGPAGSGLVGVVGRPITGY